MQTSLLLVSVASYLLGLGLAYRVWGQRSRNARVARESAAIYDADIQRQRRAAEIIHVHLERNHRGDELERGMDS